MSDLIRRLRERAHLPEFAICGEAAAALEAALCDRDQAICEAQQEIRQTHEHRPPDDLITPLHHTGNKARSHA